MEDSSSQRMESFTEKLDQVENGQGDPPGARCVQSQLCKNKTRSHNCDFCEKSFESKYKLARHVQSQTCKKKFGRHVPSCKNNGYMGLIHKLKKKYKYNVCSKKYATKSLVNHIQVHTAEQKDGLKKKHMRVHSSEKSYVCNHCGQGYAYRKNLLKHVKSHEKEKELKDTTKVEEEGDKLDHMENEQEAANSRNDGGIQGTSCKAGKKLHVCNHCGQGYTYRKSLIKHVKSHEKEKEQKDTTKVEEEGDKLDHMENEQEAVNSRNNDGIQGTSCKAVKKLHVCNHCGQRYAYRKNLIKHEERHEKDKELKDTTKVEEGDKLDQMGNEQEAAHNRNDDGIQGTLCKAGKKLHVCNHCGQGYAYRKSLIKHVKRHKKYTELKDMAEAEGGDKLDQMENGQEDANSSNDDGIQDKELEDMSEVEEKVNKLDQVEIGKEEANIINDSGIQDKELEGIAEVEEVDKLDLVENGEAATNGINDNDDIQGTSCNAMDPQNILPVMMDLESIFSEMVFSQFLPCHLIESQDATTDPQHSLMDNDDPQDSSVESDPEFTVDRDDPQDSSTESDDSDSAKEKLYDCGVCKKSFGNNSSLKSHMRVHEVGKPQVCPICGQGYACEESFKKHVKIHEENETRSQKVNFSGKSYKKSKLKRDMNGHMGVKSFVCSICNKGYTIKQSLKAHIRTHTDDRPHICEVCGKGFRFKKTLRSHMIVHMSEKPRKFVVNDMHIERA